MSFGKSCVAATLALAAASAGAQWTGLGPGGGSVDHLVADPNTPGRIYAAGFGVSVSTDAGRSWTSASAGLHGTARAAIYGFLADPDQPGRLYLIDADGRLMRSEDGAANWSPTGFQLGFGPAPFGRGRTAMADIPGGVNALLLGGDDGVLYRSVDGGATFSALSYVSWNDRTIDALAVDPADPDVVLAGLGIGATGPINGETVLRSRDGGVHWDSVSGAPALGSGADFAFVPDGSVLAVLNRRVHVSRDHGASWTPSNAYADRIEVAPAAPYEAVAMSATSCARSTDFLTGSQPCSAGLPTDATYARFTDLAVVADGASGYRALATGSGVGVRAWSPTTDAWQPSAGGLSARRVRGLALVPGAPQRMFTGRWPEDAFEDMPLLRSADAGAHWDVSLAGTARFVRSLALDPTTAGTPGAMRVYASGYSARNLAPVNGGVYASADGGASWTALDRGLPATSGTSGGVNIGTARTVKLDPRSCAAPPSRGPCRQGPLNTLFVLGSLDAKLVFRSTERGDNWVNASAGLPRYMEDGTGAREAVFPVDIEFDAGNGDILLSTVSDATDEALDPIPGSILSGVFRSTDGGSSWVHRSVGLPLMTGSASRHRDVYALAAHPRRSGVFWASTVAALGQPARIYKTTDGGANWFPSGPELANCDVRDLQVDRSAPDVIYAAGIGSGFASACIFRSEDGGASWAPVFAGAAPVGEIYDLRWDEHDQARLLVTTEQGVWELRAASDRIFDDGLDD